jgi:hypothetical protein
MSLHNFPLLLSRQTDQLLEAQCIVYRWAQISCGSSVDRLRCLHQCLIGFTVIKGKCTAFWTQVQSQASWLWVGIRANGFGMILLVSSLWSLEYFAWIGDISSRFPCGWIRLVQKTERISHAYRSHPFSCLSRVAFALFLPPFWVWCCLTVRGCGDRYRRLFVLFARYTYVNTLKQIRT